MKRNANPKNAKSQNSRRIVLAICLLTTVILISFICVKINSGCSILQPEQSPAFPIRSEHENTTAVSDISLETTKVDALPGIICWGDSLTAGAGGYGIRYPDVLQEHILFLLFDYFNTYFPDDGTNSALLDEIFFSLPDVPVINMGVGGEDTITILGRNGAIPFVVKDEFTIPKTTKPVPITFISKNGQSVAPLRQGSCGMEWVSIAGVKGVISIEQEDWENPNCEYFFSRAEKGDPVPVAAGTEIITAGSTSYQNYLPVVFMGQNGGYSGDIRVLIEQQLALINHQTENNDRFIIVGLHTGTAAERAELEQAMLAQYGDKYINLRQYMSTQALQDADMEPTPEDITAMESGSTPPSLMSDTVHFNATGYRLLGDLIFQRIYDLGYFAEIEEAIHSFTF